MNPTYEIEKEDSIPLLQQIKSKLTESGYKCRNFKTNNGIYAKHGKNWCQVYLKFRSDKVGITWQFFCSPNDQFHKLGIDYMIESSIVNFQTPKEAIAS